MPSRHYSRFINSIDKLSFVELKRANQCVKQLLSKDEMGRIIAEREQNIESCPYCRHEHLIKWGASKQGKQRFKCKEC